MQYLSYILFRLFVLLFAFIPFPVMYGLSELLALLLQYGLKYRLKVVRSNVERVFPQLSEQEKGKLIRNFYRHLADITLEAVKGFSLGPKSVVKRHNVVNPEVLEAFFKQGITVIGVTGHHGNWEWGSLSGGLQMPVPLVALYKPLSNKYLDAYMMRSRAKNGTELASILKTYYTFDKNKDRTVAYILVADQNPGKPSRAHWIPFFGIETAFLHGPEKYANMFHHAVVYVDITRVKRGYYTMTVIPICGPGEMTEEGAITRRYAEILEQKIRERPESWLWSHKRWKYTREGVLQKPGGN